MPAVGVITDQWHLQLCVCVRALKEKRVELSTPNLVHIYFIAGSRHALTLRSKGQRSRSHGYDDCHGATFIAPPLLRSCAAAAAGVV